MYKFGTHTLKCHNFGSMKSFRKKSGFRAEVHIGTSIAILLARRRHTVRYSSNLNSHVPRKIIADHMSASNILNLPYYSFNSKKYRFVYLKAWKIDFKSVWYKLVMLFMVFVFLYVFICIIWSSQLYKDHCTNVHNATDLYLQIFNYPFWYSQKE